MIFKGLPFLPFLQIGTPRVSRREEERMRKPLLSATMMVVFLILVGGCSREEQNQNTAQSAENMRKAIVQPLRQKIQPSNNQKQEEREIQPAPAPQVVDSRPASEERNEPEKGTPVAPPVVKPEPMKARSPDEKRPQPAAGSASMDSRDFYVVKPGDTLARIAGKRKVYGDPLKWAVLYRLNAAALESLPGTDNLPDLPLPPETRLRIVRPEEAKGNIEKRSGSVWVVNVLSATTNSEVIPAVVGLARKDYPVYVVSARVNEKDWMRVRVGFFKTREQAESEGKRIMEMMNLKDTWVAKLPKGEFVQFAGY
jgi:cell division septation protein DedD